MVHVHLVSNNPLFQEVISATLSHYANIEFILAISAEDRERILKDQSPIIIVDERIGTHILNDFLESCRQLPNSHVILINSESNDFITTDSSRSKLNKIEDLMKAITSAPSGGNAILETVPLIANLGTLASLFAFLASIFNTPPGITLVQQLRALSAQGFTSLFDQGNNEDPSLAGITEIEEYLEVSATVPEEQLVTELAVDWTRLFRGTRTGYGPPPPYESLYIDNNDNGVTILESLAYTYQEYNAEILQTYHDRVDYIGVEFDFLRFLYELEDESFESDPEEQLSKYSDVASKYFQDHPLKWVGRFCDEAIKYAQTGFFRGFLQMVGQIMSENLIPQTSRIQ